jgi:hypothetical protein
MTNTYILQKRTTEDIWYNIDCTNLLEPLETITTVTGITSDQTGLTFSGAAINNTPITFPDGYVALPGKVISVFISDGIVLDGETNQIYTIRPVFTTNAGNTRESTVLLNVTNIPVQAGRIM